MLKKILVLVLLVCLLGTLLCACSKKISEQEAYQILLTELGVEASEITEHHIHEGTLGNEDCYTIVITLDGKQWTCYVSTSGEYLGKMEGGHSH